MNKDASIFVAGHNGLVGSAIVRALKSRGFNDIVTRSRDKLDLCDFQEVMRLIHSEHVEYVFLAAARVGGVCSNDHHEADFLLQNLQIQNNVLEASRFHGVKKLLFLGSACVYPRLAAEPVSEDALLSGPLEPSNQWYALAKIAGIKLCQAMRRQYGCNFISAMPTNLYGPGDKYDYTSSHVLPALIRKFHEAKLLQLPAVTCWGSGTPRREFIYSDDLAEACITLMESYEGESPVNIGTGRDITIRELAESIADVVGFGGSIQWDTSKPDGTPRRLLDNSKITALGWEQKIFLKQGLERTYADYVAHQLSPFADKIYDSMR